MVVGGHYSGGHRKDSACACACACLQASFLDMEPWVRTALPIDIPLTAPGASSIGEASTGASMLASPGARVRIAPHIPWKLQLSRHLCFLWAMRVVSASLQGNASSRRENKILYSVRHAREDAWHIVAVAVCGFGSHVHGACKRGRSCLDQCPTNGLSDLRRVGSDSMRHTGSRVAGWAPRSDIWGAAKAMDLRDQVLAKPRRDSIEMSWIEERPLIECAHK